MNIVIAVDDNYIEHAKTMLFSLAVNNAERMDVFLLYSSVSPENLDNFRRFVTNKCRGKLTPIPVPASIFEGVPVGKWLSAETYYRLLTPELLPEPLDRALWLDADIIVKGDISEFYHQSFDGCLAVACPEESMKNHRRLGLSDTHRYFNAGVILFDLPAMRKAISVSDIFDCVAVHGDHLDCMDQDVLNVLLMDRVKYADAEVYNNGAFGFSVLNDSKMRSLKEKARIIHYWGSVKPWNAKGVNWADRYWWHYERKRGDRKKAVLSYRVKNAPVKAGAIARELRFIVKGQLKKLK